MVGDAAGNLNGNICQVLRLLGELSGIPKDVRGTESRWATFRALLWRQLLGAMVRRSLVLVVVAT